MRRRPAARGGFTLVELLIVIAIIVVLMAIALPVFNSAREKVRQSACMANLHEIAMALRMYRMDEGAYPGPYDPVIAEGGLNALYPTYLTSRKSLICPDDVIQDTAGYMAQLGPGIETAAYMKNHPIPKTHRLYQDYLRWVTYSRTYEQLITISGQMYLWRDPTTNAYLPAFFSERYSSYNNYYNYVGYAGWPETREQADTFRPYILLNYTGFIQPMMRGENIAAIYEWYRWDPAGLLGLDHKNSSGCYDNCKYINQFLHLNLARQVYWPEYQATNPQNDLNSVTRYKDDLGRPLWEPSPNNDRNAWDFLPDGLPSAVFPGLIDRNAPDNTIITRCTHHRPWTKVRLSQTREKPAKGERGAGQENQPTFSYSQDLRPKDTQKDIVLRLDGSVQMVPIMGGYNWATQSPLTH
jgi:prepilin-type N-terminal cleavage/methylation domain-containing protein